MQEIVDDYGDKPETMRPLMYKLMIDTMECYGYDSGLKIFKKAMINPPTHWIAMRSLGWIKCSGCNRMIKTESPDCYFFCPSCGNIMSDNVVYE